MSQTVTLRPTKVEQPNRNKESGLQGKHFKVEVRRNGETHEVNTKYQDDPKYHHEWSNAEEIFKKDGVIQCGRPSTKHCSHKTYYGIKGYRNTCPIAGLSGTYTQPATLRLFFDLKAKGISSSAKIEKVEISFDHRCTGVSVANGTENTVWGPNFNGFNVYENRKVLKVKLGNKEQILNQNPPLSKSFSNTGQFTFTNITYKDLTENGLDIIYGNNLSTNPGNIYIKNLVAKVYYTDGTPYISGTQSSDSLYVSGGSSCRTSIKFTIDAGYKQGESVVPVSKAPKNLRNDIKYSIEDPDNLIQLTYVNDEKNQRRRIYTLTDKTLITGKKKIKFYIDGTKKSITFEYEAIRAKKPDIKIPNQIERNTKNENVTSIIASKGCAGTITAYVDKITTSSKKYTFNNLNLNNLRNIILQEDIDNFYEFLATQVPCGPHIIYFKIDNEPNDDAIKRNIEIIPTTYKFKVIDPLDNTEITSYETPQNKTQNKTLTITYVETKQRFISPSFVIENPTHGTDKKIIDNKPWSTANNNTSTSLVIGRYYPGDYTIRVRESEISCAGDPYFFKVSIIPSHRQYFDELFVRGEDSTAFNYDYLVALEGDTIDEPVYVYQQELASSFKDIKICTTQNNNFAGLAEHNSVELTIKNTSSNDIQNLLLELNTLVEDDDNILHVTSNEWLESDGIFYNFKENFEKYNENYKELITVKNLTPDDDYFDEEDVYLRIAKLKAQSDITIKIPFGSGIPKKVYLQILLFGQPLALHEKINCDNPNSETFDKICLQVYDSILTHMDITGKTDLFMPNDGYMLPESCPEECFHTQLTYSIKNIDTSNIEATPKTVIYNDPRLVPVSFEYDGESYTLTDHKNNNENKNKIKFDYGESYRQFPIVEERVDAYIQFEGHNEIHLHQYTDYKGETIFYVNIPSTVGETYTVKKLLDYMSIEYKGNNFYNGTKYTTPETKYVKDNTRNLSFYPSRNITYFDVNKAIVDEIDYHIGQVVPVKVELIGQAKYIENKITFNPEIKTALQEDKLTVFYKICNLDKNKGKLITSFETDDYKLIPNKVSKTVYCGIKTDKELSTKLTKVIVENKSLNRLYLSLENRERDNKDITIVIKEYMTIEKYDVVGYKLDKGTITVNNNQIIWSIDYIEEDTTINGYIDFKAKEVGFSKIESTITDFIDSMPELQFDEESYQCDCRKGDLNE